jgi:sugar transferase EpsL
VWYVDNRSLLLDIRIMFLTVSRVFSGSGVSAEGHASVSKFTGNKTADQSRLSGGVTA